MGRNFENRRAKCHPERAHLAHGLCRECYRKQFPSGTPSAHRNKHARIPATEEQRLAWARAFRTDGHLSFAPWARELLDGRAAALGFTSSDKVGQGDDE